MPRKIRELVRDLKKYGWYVDRQKDSHREESGDCSALFVEGVCHDENRITAYAKTKTRIPDPPAVQGWSGDEYGEDVLWAAT